MSGVTEILTPLGGLRLSLSCGATAVGEPDHLAALPSGARVAQWRSVEGLMVDLLVARYDSVAPRLDGGPRCVCWGAEWRMHARVADTAPITITSLLPEGTLGEANGDEDLTMTEVVTGDWCLTVAGLDDCWYQAEDYAHLLPPSWSGRFGEWTPDRGFDGVRPVVRGVTWHLPGLRGGESARAFTTVAWCAAGDERSELAPFYAVDIRPADLLAAAGL